ncbi:MAG: YggS family pyridoxal phosphate-dependent enzyme [Candidatus Malihini olakiniferum]
MKPIEQNLQNVREKIATAATACGRDPHAVTLLAVSKTKPVAAIEEAIACGQFSFGENYLQEGVCKVLHFREVLPQVNIEWHFIGPLQSNKSRLIAEHFDWCHTVDRPKIAQRLSEKRSAALAPLNVLLQVNISGEASKSGIAPADLPVLATTVAALPHLTLRGLMAIPAPENDYARQLAVFQTMNDLFAQVKLHYPQVDTLSMGMTDDMSAAIAAGSTLVRIGIAIFGARDYPDHR